MSIFAKIAYSEMVSSKKRELVGHWWAIENLSKCAQRICRGGKNRMESWIKNRRMEETCEFCLKRLSLGDIRNFKKRGLINPRCEKTGFLEYKDRFCDLQIPENMGLSQAQKDHKTECIMFQKSAEEKEEVTPTIIKLPKPKSKLVFDKEKTIIHQR